MCHFLTILAFLLGSLAFHCASLSVLIICKNPHNIFDQPVVSLFFCLFKAANLIKGLRKGYDIIAEAFK